MQDQDSVTVSFQLRTLGALEIRNSDGKPVGGLTRQPKRLALFVYLACLPRSQRVTRDVLTSLFWPDSPDARARNALAQGLHVLRKELGGGVIETEGTERVGLRPRAVTTDARAVEEEFEDHRWEEALGLYRGEFLPGFHVSGADGFERWVDERRRRLHAMAVRAAWHAAARAEWEGDLSRAIELTRRGVALAPLEEVGCRYLMALQTTSGDAAGAVRTFDRHAERMETELGFVPSGPAAAAAEALREGRPPEELETPLTALGSQDEARSAHDPGAAEHTPVRPGQLAHDVNRETVTSPTQAPLLKAGAWVAAAMAIMASVAMLLTERSEATPALIPGTVHVGTRGAVAGDGREARVGALVATALSTAPFTQAVRIDTSVVPDPSVAGRAHGSEHTVIIGPEASGAMAFAVLDHREGRTVEAGSLLSELPDSVIASKVLGATALHLDRSVADWGGHSSVRPSYWGARAFIEGMRAWRDMRHSDSFESLRRATELDSWFPLAMLELAEARLAQPPGDSLLAELASRRSELTRYEALHLRQLETRMSGDRATEYEAAKELGTLVPERFLSVAAALAVDLGRYDEAITLGDRVDSRRAIIPNADYARIAGRHALGLHQREHEIADSLRRLNPESRFYVNFTVGALGALGKSEEIERLLRQEDVRPRPWDPRAALGARSLAVTELVSHGFEAEAQHVLGRGIAQLDESPDSTIRWTPTAGWFYRQAGQLDRAEAVQRRLLDAYPEWPGVTAAFQELALIEVYRGDREGALRWVAALDDWTAHPGVRDEATVYQAVIYASLGEAERAIALLRHAVRLGFSLARLRDPGWELRVLRGDPEFDALLVHPTF